ncbi:nucleotidyltransferase domain-containing protein [Candidatus Bathyarchaeota archaeon]|nr:nucleotidyltransferase domain-containing protein [Candidatus Bathyarchaeota archaeon]MBS7617896.1 nucleotidyltransferase domain-containing protein [Candidatus Bathyarchaeota archaeon]
MGQIARQWRFWSEAIAKAAYEVLGSCNVYVFGSVAEGRATGGSDVDVLIVANSLPGNFRARGELIAKIEEAANLPLYHPFQIHLATWKEAEVNPIYQGAVDKGIPIFVGMLSDRREFRKS